MNKVNTLLILNLIIAFLMFFNKAMSQDIKDQKEILQICSQMPEIEKYLQDSNREIVIMQHGVDFQFSYDMEVSGKKVILLKKEEIKQRNITSYFLFWRFDIGTNDAYIEYSYILNESEFLLIELEIKKSTGIWLISGSKVERRAI